MDFDDEQRMQSESDVKTDNKALEIIEKQKKERQAKATKVRNEGVDGPKDPEQTAGSEIDLEIEDPGAANKVAEEGS